jgi:hypothetical protein
VTGLVAAFVLAATIAAFLLVIPAARRTRLRWAHPAVAWLALELVFFGIGSAVLAVTDEGPEAALYVGAGVLAFGLAVAASDRLARGRIATRPRNVDEPADELVEPPRPIRPAVVVALAVIGVAALLPTLAKVGIPFLASDITGARSEVGGLDLQILRVALPAAVLVAVIGAIRADTRRARAIAVGAFVIAVGAELALASRYLSAELVATVGLGVVFTGRAIPVRILAASGAIGVMLFVSVGILRAYDQAAGRELEFAVERSVNRILLIEPRTLDALQATIPSDEPFFGGLTWLRRLGPILGRPDIPNLGYWIYPRLFPDQQTTGYAAPGLFGEAWANFGWLGLIVIAALGLVAERLGALIASRRRDTADIVVAALATLFLARTHAIGLNGLVILGVIVAVWRLLVAPTGELARDLRAVAAWRL